MKEPFSNRPSKQEQLIARESYETLVSSIENLETEEPIIEIEETKEEIKIPLNALKLLANILRATSEGKPVSIVPLVSELTTQASAEFLGCSRPHLVKLLETGKIPFVKVGKHRRVKFEDLKKYKDMQKKEQRDLLAKMMQSDEELGLYDT